MKYIKTNMGEIYPTTEGRKVEDFNRIYENIGLGTRVLAIGDSIEELCDEFVVVPDKDAKTFIATQFIRDGGSYTCSTVYGAIWTKKGLIYVAKMNESGELELL